MSPVLKVQKALAMIVLVGASAASAAERAAPRQTSEFSASCVGSFTVEATSQAYYLPERCAGGHLPNPSCGRAPTLPPVAGYTAVVTLASTDSGCEAVTAKYGVSALGTRLVGVTLSDATGLLEAIAAADGARGAVGTFALVQSFEYAVQDTLPLFPLAHAEALTFVGTVPAGYGTSAGRFALGYQVDAYKTYGVKPLASLSETSTVALAKKLGAIVTSQDGHVNDYQPFAALFEDLNVGSDGAAAGVLEVILGLFEQEAAQQYPASFFFDFNVGGSAGAIFANVVNRLSARPGLLSSGERTQLLTSYPGLLLTYSDSCFSANSRILEDALVTLVGQVEAGSLPSKVVSKPTLQTLARQLQGTDFGHCATALVTDDVKALAKSLLDAL